MRRSSWLVFVCLSLVGGLLSGCRRSRKFRLTFINTTLQAREVQLEVSGAGDVYAGVAGPDGGKATCSIRIRKSSLPAKCAWTAGELSGQFVITGDQSKIRVNINSRAAATGPAVIEPVKAPATMPKAPASAPSAGPAGPLKKSATNSKGQSDKD